MVSARQRAGLRTSARSIARPARTPGALRNSGRGRRLCQRKSCKNYPPRLILVSPARSMSAQTFAIPHAGARVPSSLLRPAPVSARSGLLSQQRAASMRALPAWKRSKTHGVAEARGRGFKVPAELIGARRRNEDQARRVVLQNLAPTQRRPRPEFRRAPGVFAGRATERGRHFEPASSRPSYPFFSLSSSREPHPPKNRPRENAACLQSAMSHFIRCLLPPRVEAHLSIGRIDS